MELGSWALVHAPSLLGLIPLILYVVLSMKMTKNMVMPIAIAVFVGFVLSGNGAIAFGRSMASNLGGLMGQVGLIVMLAAGLGGVMSKVGVTKTLCGWIIKAFRIKSKVSAMLVISLCTFLLALAMGSGLTAAAVCVTFAIPLAATFGISKLVLTGIEFFVGYAGMTLSPFSATNIAAMEITGLTFPEFLMWAALPYSVVTIAASLFICFRADKKYAGLPDIEYYEAEKTEDTEASRDAKRATIAFILTFFACVAWMIAFSGGLAFTIFYMICLAFVVTVVGKYDIYDALDTFLKQAATQFPMFITLILIQIMLDTITAMGGFEALGEVCRRIIPESGSQSILMIIGTLFGAFGINGAAAAQMAVIDGVFNTMVATVALPMTMWCMTLIMGSLPSNFIFPGSTQWGVMGVCQCSDLKRVMKMCWFVSAAELLAAIVYSLVMPAIF